MLHGFMFQLADKRLQNAGINIKRYIWHMYRGNNHAHTCWASTHMAQTKRRLVEGRNYLQKESEPPRSGPSIGSILLFESSLPSSAVRTLQLMPRSHPK